MLEKADFRVNCGGHLFVSPDLELGGFVYIYFHIYVV